MELVPIVKMGIAIKTDPVEIKDTKFGNVTEIMKHTSGMFCLVRSVPKPVVQHGSSKVQQMTHEQAQSTVLLYMAFQNKVIVPQTQYKKFNTTTAYYVKVLIILPL